MPYSAENTVCKILKNRISDKIFQHESTTCLVRPFSFRLSKPLRGIGIVQIASGCQKGSRSTKGKAANKDEAGGCLALTKQTFQRDPLGACLGSTGLRSQHKRGINMTASGGVSGVNIKDNTFLPAAFGVN